MMTYPDGIPAETGPRIEELQAEILRLEAIIKLKDQQIRLLNLRLWGPKADKLSEAQLALLPQELCVSSQEVDQEARRPQEEKELARSQPRRPRSHPGRTVLPEHLERRIELVACSPEDCRCSRCGEERPLIGYEEREELACKPAEFFIRVIRREKRGSHCLEEQGVAIAPAPARIVPKGKLSNEVIIEALAAKFQQHQPIYRQCAVLSENYGIELSRQTLNEAILACGELLVPVVRAQGAELLAGDYIQADETTVACQSAERTGKNHRAFIWEFSRPGGPVVFRFEWSRSRAAPQDFLKSFRGKLQCDGYSVYDQLGSGIVYVACMAHIRREFVDAAKLSPLDPLPVEIAGRIGELYKIEQEARLQGLDAAGRLALRQSRSRPLMAALKERIIAVRQQLSPASALAKACDYALGQWSRMEEYLKDGQTEIDNNWCEGGMRPIALGRKNWLHIGSKAAGPKVAAIMSVVETCRRLDIPLRGYLYEVLPRLGDWPITRVGELTPARWKAAQAS